MVVTLPIFADTPRSCACLSQGRLCGHSHDRQRHHGKEQESVLHGAAFSICEGSSARENGSHEGDIFVPSDIQPVF